MYPAGRFSKREMKREQPSYNLSGLLCSLIIFGIGFALACVGFYVGGLDQTVQICLIAVGFVVMIVGVIYFYYKGGCSACSRPSI